MRVPCNVPAARFAPTSQPETAPVAWDGLVEPPRLVAHFLAHPPEGFRTFTLADGTPGFSAQLDPLTTAEATFRRRVRALPLSRHWLPWLRLRTCFVGTTVSEYALVQPGIEPRARVAQLLGRFRASGETLLVVKDLPHLSPLLDPAASQRLRAFADALQDAGFAMLSGQALAYVPVTFVASDAYLAGLSRGARRDVRRKLRGRAAVAVETVATGPGWSDPALRAQVYRLYCNVYEQSELKFDRLTQGFFDAVLQDPALDGRVFLYRVDGCLVAFNLCFVRGGALIDKYVGFEYPHAREHNLYALSWIHNLEYAAANGLSWFIAGWTDPQIKAHLGARFTFTRHAVYARNPLLRAALLRWSRHFESDRDWFESRHPPAADRP